MPKGAAWLLSLRQPLRTQPHSQRNKIHLLPQIQKLERAASSKFQLPTITSEDFGQLMLRSFGIQWVSEHLEPFWSSSQTTAREKKGHLELGRLVVQQLGSLVHEVLVHARLLADGRTDPEDERLRRLNLAQPTLTERLGFGNAFSAFFELSKTIFHKIVDSILTKICNVQVLRSFPNEKSDEFLQAGKGPRGGPSAP